MIDKATAHVHAAELLHQHRHYRDVISRAYYAVFSAMQACVGDPPRGRWEHPGLRAVFLRILTERGTPVETCRELRKRLRYLLDTREVADYSTEEVDEQMAIDAREIAREVLRIVQEGAP